MKQAARKIPVLHDFVKLIVHNATPGNCSTFNIYNNFPQAI